MKDFGKDLFMGLTKSIIDGSPFYVKHNWTFLGYVMGCWTCFGFGFNLIGLLWKSNNLTSLAQ